MASPQVENGYTRISNELLDHMCAFRMPGECRMVFDSIIRKTWGFGKKNDKIPNSQLVKMTGMPKANVSRALSKLITNKLVIQSDNKLSVNKNYEEWISFKTLSKVITGKKNRRVLSKVITPVIQSDNKTLSKVMDSKEKKETNKRNIGKSTVNSGSKAKAFGNHEIEYILNSYKKNMGFSPTDRSPRHTAQNMRQIINSFIKRTADKRKFTFEGIVDRTFEIYMQRDSAFLGETLNVVKRKMKVILEQTESKLKGGEQI